MLKDEIITILNDVDDDIVSYEGSNLLDDGIIDSFTIMEIVNDLSYKMNVKITPSDITEDNFKTVDAIVTFVSSLLN